MHEAFFLLVVLGLNVIIGIIQDLRAKVALEQLQILMAPRIVRMEQDGKERIILLDEIKINDRLKISLGDQIPADGELLESFGLEINEALITGESKNIVKQKGNRVLAGSIATSGSGILLVDTEATNSFVAKMTEKIKQYKLSPSPIQKTLNTFISYMTYLLIAIVIYVVIHGLTVNALIPLIIKDIGALTSTLVPQGLILATTIFFAYGAIKLFKKQVLLQEINATEKLGRIKNLCLDKTGTLTENEPIVEDCILYPGRNMGELEQLMSGYIQSNTGISATGYALKKAVGKTFNGQILDSLPFSSTRKFGAVTLQNNNEKTTVVVGAPDILMPNIVEDSEKQWVKAVLDIHTVKAKRLVLITRAEELPQPEGMGKIKLSVLGIYILHNPLRPGTADIINFFQNRGVRIRVISGDNAGTVQAVAVMAGIKHSDLIITGPEMEKWDEEEYMERVPAYHLFARISPEQKEKIISVLQTTGFTAMVGDGANDALAIKKADLGIAMFEGSGATRQIAEVVLMNNSFSALPEGVAMAETIVTNIELVASVFFYSIGTGLGLFFILATLGYLYPLSPRNTTIINYCVLWLPMTYWALFPASKKGLDPDQSFLRRILPFSLVNSFLTAVTATVVFLLGPSSHQESGSSIFVVMTLIILGFWFFILAPKAYGVAMDQTHKNITYILGGVVFVFITFVMFQPSWSNFFGLESPDLLYSILTISLAFLCGRLQYLITKKWFSGKTAKPI